jgi:8-oxo-dGTP diphosphatase
VKVINKRNNIKWLSPDATLTLAETTEYDFNKSLITSVFAFIIYKQKILVIFNKKPNRGYEIPGGHVEYNEDCEMALYRECLEEACVEITDIQLIAIHEINNIQKDNRYPLKGYQAFYFAKVKRINPFIENEEIREVKWLNKDEFLSLEWSKYYPDLAKLFVDKYF